MNIVDANLFILFLCIKSWLERIATFIVRYISPTAAFRTTLQIEDNGVQKTASLVIIGYDWVIGNIKVKECYLIPSEAAEGEIRDDIDTIEPYLEICGTLQKKRQIYASVASDGKEIEDIGDILSHLLCNYSGSVTALSSYTRAVLVAICRQYISSEGAQFEITLSEERYIDGRSALIEARVDQDKTAKYWTIVFG